jgi:hypothetical protein
VLSARTRPRDPVQPLCGLLDGVIADRRHDHGQSGYGEQHPCKHRDPVVSALKRIVQMQHIEECEDHEELPEEDPVGDLAKKTHDAVAEQSSEAGPLA